MEQENLALNSFCLSCLMFLHSIKPVAPRGEGNHAGKKIESSQISSNSFQEILRSRRTGMNDYGVHLAI